jgi:predicted Rossmann fold flavoprotein
MADKLSDKSKDYIYDLVVVGGGAAGIFGAIIAAEKNPNLNILVLEANSHPLGKVKISGGGRCNVTHACFDPVTLSQNYPRGFRSLRSSFNRFQPENMMQWLNQKGIELKIESDYRIFPASNSSATIIDCFLDLINQYDIKLWCNQKVKNIQVERIDQNNSPNDSKIFLIELENKTNQSSNTNTQIIKAHQILLTTGSHRSGYQLAVNLGHQIIAPVPSLFTLQIKDTALHQLAGISIQNVAISLKMPPQIKIHRDAKLTQKGIILITHWGMSGPAILKLSAWAARELAMTNYQCQLLVNWLPDLKNQDLEKIFQQAKLDSPKRLVRNFCPLELPLRLWEYLVNKCNLAEKRYTELSTKAIQEIINRLINDQYIITGKGVFKDEFVTCGGINLSEIDFKTMESKYCKNLYFAGEILDIDGVTGGFNFQNAWTTGWIAAHSIAAYS